MTDVFDAPAKTVERDRYGRPLIVPPKGGKAKPYTRCTTFVDVLDDKFNLQQWQQRMVALGLASRPDLLLAVSAHSGDKTHLNRITGEAREAAAASAAATTGTAIHALTEKIDRGEELPPVPEAYRADLDAYRGATAGLDVLAVEQFLVHDELRIGGTADRVYGYGGQYYIGDVKTGSIEFGAMKIAMQLATYAHSVPYDHVAKRRMPREFQVDTDYGIVVHLPAGTGTCELVWVDLVRGWNAVQVAHEVREWRKVKDWYSPFVPDTTLVDAAADFVEEAINTAIDMEVDKATTLDELRAVYTRLVVAGEDPDRVLVSCNQRRSELEEA